MKKITLTALFLLAFLLTACGKGEEAQKTETLVGDTTNEIVEDVVEDELQTDMTKSTIETFEEEDNSGNSFGCAEGEKVVNHYYAAETRVKTITSLEGNMPYFIGRDNLQKGYQIVQTF